MFGVAFWKVAGQRSGQQVASWKVLARSSGALLEASWALLGASWALLKLVALGDSWGALGGLLPRLLAAKLGQVGAQTLLRRFRQSRRQGSILGHFSGPRAFQEALEG